MIQLTTKNLIIFGQGINKSHPYIFPILDSILNEDVKGFQQNFNKKLTINYQKWRKNQFLNMLFLEL